jgi:branched-chain amino acid transport system permease protein
MMGINPTRTYLIVWIMGISSLGVAGPMLSSIFTFHPMVATSWQMIAFMSVVLGGLGNVLAALVGGVIMSVAMELGNAFLPGSLGPVLPFLIFVIVLLVKPEGLFGESARGAK